MHLHTGNNVIARGRSTHFSRCILKGRPRFYIRVPLEKNVYRRPFRSYLTGKTLIQAILGGFGANTLNFQKPVFLILKRHIPASDPSLFYKKTLQFLKRVSGSSNSYKGVCFSCCRPQDQIETTFQIQIPSSYHL